MNTLSFGEYVQQLRRAKRLGLREAAAHLQVTPGHLSKIERDLASPPKGQVIQRMADLYGVPLDELCSRATPKRVIDASTADETLAPVIAAFYRLAIGRSNQDHLKMLEAVLDGLDLPPDQREHWRREFKRAISEFESDSDSNIGFSRLGNSMPNELYDLHAVPRRLSRRRIEQMASFVLSRFLGGDLTRYSPPTPIDKLIEFSDPPIDLRVFGREFSPPLRDGSPSVLGTCYRKRDGQSVVSVHEELLNSGLSSERRRGNFTLGHEYFHAIEHLPLVPADAIGGALSRRAVSIELNPGVRATTSGHGHKLQSFEDWREWQANTFSAAILMPSFAVIDVFREFISKDDIVAEDPYSLAVEISKMEVISIRNQLFSLVDLFDVNPAQWAFA